MSSYRYTVAHPDEIVSPPPRISFDNSMFDSDTARFTVDLSGVVDDMVRQMFEMEEQARLDVVVSYLRSIGYRVFEPGVDVSYIVYP